MLPTSLVFPTGGQCTLTYEKPAGWLRATWTGHIGAAEARCGAAAYLEQVGPTHCLYLLNDNVGLRGPWFSSLRWLLADWLPQAQRLGLRYVAHVVQRDTQVDIFTRHYFHQPVVEAVEWRLFYEVAAAEAWLRSCQQPLKPAPFTYPAFP